MWRIFPTSQISMMKLTIRVKTILNVNNFSKKAAKEKKARNDKTC